jgi:pimeloyl-ACP methyl ester carboxylesterase
MRSCADTELRQIPGPSTLSPLVFLHEGLGSVAMWQGRAGDWPAQICLAAGRAGWVYSRRGYGQSCTIQDVRGSGQLTADYMHREAWEVLPLLFKDWGVENPVLIGHSDGATIALLHAARFSLAGIVVMAPHLLVEEMTISAIQAAKKAYKEGDLRQKLMRYHADVDCAFWQWNDVWLSPAFQSFDIREECQAITAPLLAMQGTDDAYGSLRHLNELHTAGTIERHVLPSCGHSPHKDQAQKSLALVVGFLAGLV